MNERKIKRLKRVLWLIIIAILGVLSVWVIINRSSIWKNITFDKQENIAAYEQDKNNQNDSTSSSRLEIPALNVIANLFFPNNTWDLYRGFGDGVGHMPGTATPGQAGNSVFFGHSSGRGGSYYETIFSTLHRLETGDEVYIYQDSKLYKYVVASKKVVSSNDLSVLDQGTDKQLTLVTCWPVGTDWQRYVVVANQVSETDNSSN